MRKNILITGASTGLGEGMAREWAAKGFQLLQQMQLNLNLQGRRYP